MKTVKIVGKRVYPTNVLFFLEDIEGDSLGSFHVRTDGWEDEDGGCMDEPDRVDKAIEEVKYQLGAYYDNVICEILR